MARTVNPQTHAAKRDAILDAAQRAIATTGYEQMAIGDLLHDLGISSGAFYHYFDSKPALLAALAERMGERSAQDVLPIVNDPALPALDKLGRFFAALEQWKVANKRLVLAYLRVWYADGNAIVRQKLYQARVKRFTPWLEQIIRQGIAEGALNTPYPDQAARMVISLFEDLGAATAELLLAPEHAPDDLTRLARIVLGTADGIERVLGAPAGLLQRAIPNDLAEWLPPEV